MSGSLRRTVTIVNPRGLHLRPAADFAQLASRFESTVTVSHGQQAVDGKDAMNLLLLIAEQGAKLVIEVTGQDAAEALEPLAKILESIPPDPDDEETLPPREK
jgi:phosphotransferase system HPr (HPr) family protein